MEFQLADVFREIENQAAAMGLDPTIAKSLAVAENTGSGSVSGKRSYNGAAVSPVGASGVMQVMPATARGLQQAGFLPADWKHDPTNLASQVQAGLAAMKEKMGRMNDPTDLGEWASVYNGSSKTHRAYKAGQFDAMPEETKQYAEKLRRAQMELGGNAGAGRGTQGVAEAQALAGRGATTTRSATTQTQALYDPAMQNDFLNSILNYAGPGGGIDQTMQDLEKAAADRSVAANALLQAITGTGKAKGEEAGAKAAVAAGAQAKRAMILTNMNLDPTKTANEMDRAFGVITQTGDQMDKLRADINAKQQVNMVTNPLDWLMAKSQLPFMVKQFNGLVDKQNDATSRYKDLASIAGTQQSLSAATDADGILRMGAAEAKTEAAQSAAQAEKFKIELAGAEIRDAQTMKSLMGQKLQLGMQALQLSKVTETTSSSTAEKDAEKKFQAQTFANMQAMIKAAGGTPPESITELKMLTPKKREALMQAAISGTFGENLSDSFQFMHDNSSLEKLARTGGAGVAAWVQGTSMEAGKELNAMKAEADKFKKPFNGQKELPEALNRIGARYQGEAATDMRKASEFNPLRIDYKMASDAPELKNNAMAIWLKDYGPGGAKEVFTKVDEGRVLQKFAESVKTGSMPAQVAAAQISEYYRVATVKQAKATNYPMFGISKPLKTYAVQFDDLGKFGAIDLGDPAQVEQALTRKIVADKVSAFRGALMAGAGNPITAGALLSGNILNNQMGDPLAKLFGNE